MKERNIIQWKRQESLFFNDEIIELDIYYQTDNKVTFTNGKTAITSDTILDLQEIR